MEFLNTTNDSDDGDESFFLRLSKRPLLKLDDYETYQYEYRRLGSFSEFPQGYDISFINAAKSGLYYLGVGNEVNCFACNIRFPVSEPAEDPVETHREENPLCPLLQSTDILNKAISSDTDDESDSITVAEDHEDVNEGTGLVIASMPNNISNIANSSSPHSLPLSTNKPDLSRMELGHRPLHNNMFVEENRLRTFSTWPIIFKIDPEDLARLGFFYTGDGDKAQCAFCNGILKKWVENDDIEAEHRKYFVDCPFVKGVETRNIPRPPTEPSAPLLLQHQASATTTITRRPLSSATNTTGHAPIDYDSRLASFDASKGWKSTNINPISLAEAGFYYTGNGDNVRCHYCGGGLRNWESTDTPWIEHARWFPECRYVLAEKGEAYVAEMSERYPVNVQVAPPTERREAEIVPPPTDYALNVDFRTQAFAMGFTDEQIKETVEGYQETNGHTFLDMQSLMDALLVRIEDRPPSDEHVLSYEDNLEEDPIQIPNEAAGTAETPAAPKTKKNKKKKKKEKQSSPDTAPMAAMNVEVSALKMEEDEESRSISEENRQLKEQRICKVCMDSEVNVVFMPCGHLVACSGCAPALRACPICRALIRGSLRTYLS